MAKPIYEGRDYDLNDAIDHGVERTKESRASAAADQYRVIFNGKDITKHIADVQQGPPPYDEIREGDIELTLLDSSKFFYEAFLLMTPDEIFKANKGASPLELQVADSSAAKTLLVLVHAVCHQFHRLPVTTIVTLRCCARRVQYEHRDSKFKAVRTYGALEGTDNIYVDQEEWEGKK